VSKARTRALKEAQQKRGPGGFVPLTFDLLRSAELASLSSYAHKLLFDLLHQYNLTNNGDLSMSFEKVMKPRGWRSKETLNNARLELLESGFIIITRQGGLHQCSLYAVTFFAIDECDGKIEVSATRSPPNLWRRNTPFKIKSPSTPAVPYNHHLGTATVP
jgi:hypothetical protein